VDIADWLRRLGLERYEQAFRDDAVDGEVLAGLTAEDPSRTDRVAAVGHRRRLLDCGMSGSAWSSRAISAASSAGTR
jgi:hypothetical protein